MSYRRTGAITSTLAPMASIASLRGVVRSVRDESLGKQHLCESFSFWTFHEESISVVLFFLLRWVVDERDAGKI